jgi:hypothetical protein
MSAEHRRPMIPMELLISQGFPVYDELAEASCGDAGVKLCSFVNPRQRCRNAVAGQAGNSVNVAIMGASAAWIAGCVHRDVDALAPQLFELKPRQIGRFASAIFGTAGAS